MSHGTAAEVAQKHARRLKAAVPDIEAGINRVTEAPGVKAAAKSEKMLAGITDAVQSGKWGRRVASVTLDDWKEKAISKGLQRIAGGVDAALPKTTAFFDKLLPFQDNLSKQIAQMSDLTLEDSIARATAQIRGMSKFER